MCERVRFRVTEPMLGAAYCHCKRCQRRTGTAFSASALTVPGSFEVTEGEELLGVHKPQDPPGWHKYFCSRCGSQIFTQSHEDPKLVSVRMGALDEDPGVRPGLHQFVAYKASWDELPDDGLPRFDERMPAARYQGEQE
ncbi:MAG: hypothetical protein K0S15_2366 [Solirubrobacterales bacterium]|jgi:hypothetical protein|nr:hypothetical protein [Solirubrobacterales bacterium]